MFRPVDSHPGLQALEDNWLAIRAEYDSLKEVATQYSPTGWYWIVLRYHTLYMKRRELAPVTTKLCEAIPGIIAYSFTRIKPYGYVSPHVDDDSGDSGMMTGNLGLYCSGSTGLNSGGESKQYQEGKVWVHDSNVEHFGWNTSDKDRACLTFSYATRPVDFSKSVVVPFIMESLMNEGVKNVEEDSKTS